jgi:alpha-D-ribose 1-methylphosphonate 5-triphosphate synthase subunit PhnH
MQTLAIDPVHDTQAIFRITLDALARPGSVKQLPIAARGAPGNAWVAGVLIALLDGEISLAVQGVQDAEAVTRFVVQRTTARVVTVEEADFVLADAATIDPEFLSRLKMGSLEFPDDSATLILQVSSLLQGRALTVVGPGIPEEMTIQVGADSAGWVGARRGLERLYPRGIDILLVDDDGRLAALPRSTHIRIPEVA